VSVREEENASVCCERQWGTIARHGLDSPLAGRHEIGESRGQKWTLSREGLQKMKSEGLQERQMLEFSWRGGEKAEQQSQKERDASDRSDDQFYFRRSSLLQTDRLAVT
jgi:hypothetical protein